MHITIIRSKQKSRIICYDGDDFLNRSCGITENKTRYLHKNHIVSITVITNEFRRVEEKFNFDAWGKLALSLQALTGEFWGHILIRLVIFGAGRI